MTTYINSMIEQPWLQDDKLDAPISIRWTEWVNYYIARRNQTNNQPFTITCGFRPKAVYVVWTSLDVRWQQYYSKSYTCEIDEVLTTTMFYKNDTGTGWNMTDYWTWTSTTVPCLYHDPLLDVNFRREIFITEFLEDGVRFWTVNIQWDDYSLAITIIR